MKPRTAESIERTAKAVREEARKGGREITQEQAKKIVAAAVERAEKRNR